MHCRNSFIPYAQFEQIAANCCICDLQQAVDQVTTVYELVMDMRTDIDNVLLTVFNDASQLLNQIGEEIKMPRIVGRQANRSNGVASTPEKYYRLTIAVPYIDDFLSQLNERFLAHTKFLCGLYMLMPNKCGSITKEWVIENLSVYDSFVDMDRVWAEI